MPKQNLIHCFWGYKLINSKNIYLLIALEIWKGIFTGPVSLLLKNYCTDMDPVLWIKDIHSLSIVYDNAVYNNFCLYQKRLYTTHGSIWLWLICFSHTLENYRAVQKNKISICTDMLRSLDVLDEKCNLYMQIVKTFMKNIYLYVFWNV